MPWKQRRSVPCFAPCDFGRRVKAPPAGLIAFLLAGLALARVAPADARSALFPPEVFARGPQGIYAIRPPNTFRHDNGSLVCQITNLGIIGNPYINEPSFGWRGGTYLYGGGLWIGAIDQDNEPHVSTALVSLELRPSLLLVDTIYSTHAGVSGGARRGTPDADDDRDGLIDEDFLNGKDDDGDGRIDEDFEAIGQDMLACEYWDNAPETIAQLADHIPLGIRISQRSFAWDADPYRDFVGFDYTLTNIGDQHLRNLYLGFYLDVDAGPPAHDRYWTDDLAAFIPLDTTVVLAGLPAACARRHVALDIAAAHDVPDNGTTITGGDVAGWLGVMFLGYPTDPAGLAAPARVEAHTVRFLEASGAYPLGDPRTDFERYDLLAQGTRPNRDHTQVGDYRMVISAGPFARLDPGQTLNFQTALAIGEGRAGLVRSALNAEHLYHGVGFDADQDPTTGVDGKETCLRLPQPGGEIIWDNPCDTLNVVIRVPGTGSCFWVDADCNPCTGTGGREGLLHWAQADSLTAITFLALTAQREAAGVRIAFRIDADSRAAAVSIERRASAAASAWRRVSEPSVPIARDGSGHWLDTAAPAGGRYRYRVALLEASGVTRHSGEVEIDDGPAAAVPRVQLLAPYPNPAAHETWFPFVLPAPPGGGDVICTLRIVDAAGRSVRDLHAGALPAGSGGLGWDGRDDRGQPVASGLYLAVLDALGARSVRKIVVRP